MNQCTFWYKEIFGFSYNSYKPPPREVTEVVSPASMASKRKMQQNETSNKKICNNDPDGYNQISMMMMMIMH